MHTLHIFNPENDIALGNNLRYFTPPRNAALLRRHGSMLMAWIAGDGDLIYSDIKDNEQWLESMAPVIKRDLSVFRPSDIHDITNIRPWGWSNAIAGELCHAGLSPDMMPATGAIEKIRAISHRRSSVFINSKLRDAGVHAPIPVEITGTAALDEYLDKHPRAVIKSPWSSSGRGVIYSGNMERRCLLALAGGMMKNQGSILIEPELNRLMDFAMLFEAGGDVVRSIGLSVFETGKGGNYSGNIVASQQHLTSLITKYVSEETLTGIRVRLEHILSELICNHYSGICGIDMMVYLDNDHTPRIAPCIELNLRNTMGYVALCLSRTIAAPGITGHMRIRYKGNYGSNAGTDKPPRFDSNGYLAEGTLELVPTNSYFDISLTID